GGARAGAPRDRGARGPCASVSAPLVTENPPMTPTLGNGKICYVEMPANDVQRSAEFYEKVFGWKIRTRGDGATAFDDGVGEVSGTWVTGRPPSRADGVLVYIIVESGDATIESRV